MLKKMSLGFIAFLQALSIAVYCGLIGSIFINGPRWFVPTPTFLGPTLFLMLFVISAIVCSLLFGGYAFILFWEHKNTKSALKLVAYTTAWLATFTFSILLFFLLTNLSK